MVIDRGEPLDFTDAIVVDGVRVPSTFALRDVAELLPYAKNSRDHSKAQVAELAEHIKKVGWTNPILVAGNKVLAGHGRLMAAKLLGMLRVPCIDLSHLSDEEQRAYVIWDNRSAEKSEWNLGFLKMETDELRELGLDLELETGFAEEDLAKLFEGMIELPGEGEGDPDDAPPAPAEPHSVAGDVWICGAHRVMCGSSAHLDAWSQLLGGEHADVCFTDPPYNVDVGRKNRLLDKTLGGIRSKSGAIDNDKLSDADFEKLILDVYGNLVHVLKPGGVIYVAHSDKAGGLFRTLFEKVGFHFSQSLIWKKNVHVLGLSDFQPIHEPILYGWKPGSKHRWYGGRKNTTVMEFGEGGPFTQMADGRWQVKVGDSVLVVDGAAMVTEQPSSVIVESKPMKSGLHPTQKPVALVERLLKQSARPGDLVVDAFGGSGTTLIAADRLGMCARLMELDPKFADVIVRRWEQFTGRRAVHAVSGLPFPSEDETRAEPESLPVGSVDPALQSDPF